MKKLSILLLFVFVFAGCGGGAITTPPDEARLVEIAQCLADKGVKMYGAVWCSHCKQQKEAFGEAFDLIDYIECDANTNLETAKICVENKIESVPAWDIPGQEIISGFHEPEDLAELAGC
jgi:glutaredoxin